MELIYNIEIINNIQTNIQKNYRHKIKNTIKTAIYINIDLSKLMI